MLRRLYVKHMLVLLLVMHYSLCNLEYRSRYTKTGLDHFENRSVIRALCFVSLVLVCYLQDEDEQCSLFLDLSQFCSVFGLPDERLGEVVGAAIWITDETVTGEELSAHAGKALAKFKGNIFLWLWVLLLWVLYGVFVVSLLCSLWFFFGILLASTDH